MKRDRLVLRELLESDEGSFRRAAQDYGTSDPAQPFAFGWSARSNFREYLNMIRNWTHGKDLPDGWVPAFFYVGVVDGEIVGRLSLRCELSDYLSRIGGHIGYAVVPRHRGKGYGTEMLQEALVVCRALGMPKVLLTCDTDNWASMKIIEKCGGVFESITDYPELEKQKRRYWIYLDGAPTG